MLQTKKEREREKRKIKRKLKTFNLNWRNDDFNENDINACLHNFGKSTRIKKKT